MTLQRHREAKETNIEIKFFSASTPVAYPETEKHKLLFVDSGTLKIESNRGTATLPENHFTCLPARYEYLFRAAADTSLTLVYFDNEFFQEHVTLQLLPPPEPEKTTDYYLPVYRLQPHLHEFLQAFRLAEPTLRSNPAYQQLKKNELFFLLIYYHPVCELSRLFQPLFNREQDFRQQVGLYYRQVNTVAELGKVLGYSQSTLNRLFHRTFGMAAYQCIQLQKAGKIKACLADRSLSFKTIRTRFGFTSPSHLTKFCKNYFGATPSELRKAATSEKDAG